jgi:hypothetical protein
VKGVIDPLLLLYFKQLITFLEPIKLITMLAIYFISSVENNRKQSLIDELDGVMILKFGEGLSEKSISLLRGWTDEAIEDIISQAKRDNVVGLILEEDY